MSQIENIIEEAKAYQISRYDDELDNYFKEIGKCLIDEGTYKYGEWKYRMQDIIHDVCHLQCVKCEKEDWACKIWNKAELFKYARRKYPLWLKFVTSENIWWIVFLTLLIFPWLFSNIPDEILGNAYLIAFFPVVSFPFIMYWENHGTSGNMAGYSVLILMWAIGMATQLMAGGFFFIGLSDGTYTLSTIEEYSCFYTIGLKRYAMLALFLPLTFWDTQYIIGEPYKKK